MRVKNILAIVGSASSSSANLQLLQRIKELTKEDLILTIFDRLSDLPHFNPELSIENTPQPVLEIREAILQADGIIICTPEYIFSIPSRLKNLVEWCVATTVFSQKPTGLIVASASGQKAMGELKLIMKTVETIFNDDTTLLIQGIKGKLDREGRIIHEQTTMALLQFMIAFQQLLEKKPVPTSFDR